MTVITQDNIRSIIPSKVAKIVSLYSKEKNIEPLEALKLFYKTSIYKDLENEQTKVWWQSPEEIYRDWCMLNT
ncbi:MAG: hypothetical protein HUK24_09240 [Sphaerochaetaceae bacterium]|nr:hypothetical protein [Sphaerochaetaceae bacterium]